MSYSFATHQDDFNAEELTEDRATFIALHIELVRLSLKMSRAKFHDKELGMEINDAAFDVLHDLEKELFSPNEKCMDYCASLKSTADADYEMQVLNDLNASII
jgi:hypothetical protein